MRRVLAALFCLALPALAQAPARQEVPPDKPEHYEKYPFVTDAESHIIHDWFRPGSGHIPPGARKATEALPAALLKQARITGVLPAGWEKLLEPFPPELERQLLKLPAGYKRYLCGMNGLIVKETNSLVVDLVSLVKKLQVD